VKCQNTKDIILMHVEGIEVLNELKLRWEKTNLLELDDKEDTWFYMFTRGKNIIYIGISYHQDIRREIKQSLRAFSICTIGLSIWLGYIMETNYRRITEQIVKDVESLLIYTHQPSYNTHCKSNYTGRNNLKVKNSGCRLLRHCIKIEERNIYYTCR
jgi:hypothetical protein